MTQAVERNMGNAGGGSFAGELFRERTATKGAGADRVVVMVDGHNVPVQLSVNKVQKTGRSERDARYFLEAGGLMPGGFVETLGALLGNGMGLYAHCTARNVGHGSRLDLDALIDRRGRRARLHERPAAGLGPGVPSLRP
jgi:hypothetical protein